MKNFIFISPNFPDTYYRFCEGLKKNGFRVLGIGGCSYNELRPELKACLDEFYECWDMDNFENEVNAVRYFENKYGHIDYLESLNEYWLEKDARLREIFNIDTGIKGNEIEVYQHKSMMKEKYKLAGVKTAQYILIDTYDNALKFVEKVGYPIFAKPDKGVGAQGDFKIKNNEDLKDFFAKKEPNVTYICEQYVTGNIVSFDGICDSHSNVIFATSECFPPSISEIAKNNLDTLYYCLPDIPSDLKKIGPKVIKAFNVKNRFFHLEFFRLTQDIKGLGKVGDIIGLETNMRAPGGYTPDLINFANSVNVYQIWADGMAFDCNKQDMSHPKYFAVCASRRDNANYFYNTEDILRTFANNICCHGRYPDVLSDCMGNYYYMAKFESEEEVELFHQYVNKRVGDFSLPKAVHYVTKEKYGEGFRILKEQNSKSKKKNICDTHIDGA